MRDRLFGLPLHASLFVPEFEMVPVRPRNRREQRKRAVVAARRKRAGRHVPTYTRKQFGLVLQINGCLYAHPNTINALRPERGEGKPTTCTVCGELVAAVGGTRCEKHTEITGPWITTPHQPEATSE